MVQQKILVVDDEPDFALLLTEWLQEEGYEVLSAGDGIEALRLYFQHRPDLSTVDLRMPGMDGFQLISRMREMSDGPLLALTALGDEEYMVRGLELGVDDYMVKPVNRRIFLARIRSLLRRATTQMAAVQGYSDSSVKVNYLTHEVHIRGQAVHLRPTEFKLLGYLIQNGGRLISHGELLDQVWGDGAGSLDSLKWYISALRDKVEEDAQAPKLILTRPRVGYRYLPPQVEACAA